MDTILTRTQTPDSSDPSINEYKFFVLKPQPNAPVEQLSVSIEGNNLYWRYILSKLSIGRAKAKKAANGRKKPINKYISSATFDETQQ